MPEPAVSVVIPTHNRWPLLQLALGSALGQADVHFEVIVVDDGSADETPERLATLARAEPRLRVLRHETGRGVARARNAGIAEARGEWIAFLDDDDLWAPRKLRAQLDAAAQRDATLVYGTYLAIDAERRPVRVEPPTDPDRLPLRLLRTNPVGGPSTFMARGDLVRAVGGFDEEFSPLADWDLLLRLVGGGPAAACHELVIGYLEHATNMMITNADIATAEFVRLAAKHSEAAAEAGVEFGDLWLASWDAIRLRRSGRKLAAAGTYARRAWRTRTLSDAGRSLGVLLGEGAFQRGRRLLGRGAPDPPWLQALR